MIERVLEQGKSFSRKVAITQVVTSVNSSNIHMPVTVIPRPESTQDHNTCLHINERELTRVIYLAFYVVSIRLNRSVK